MGLFDRFLGRVLGSENRMEQSPPDREQTIGDASVGELLAELPTATGNRQPALLGELLERARNEPSAFAGHLNTVFKILDSEATAWSGAILLETIGTGTPDLLEEQTDRLITRLKAPPDEGVDEIATTLGDLQETISLPPEEFLKIVAEGPPAARGPAMSVLGRIATTEPDTIPTDRLLALARDGDATSHAAALYVGTLLVATDDDRDLPPEIIAEDAVDLAAALQQGDVDDWIWRSLSRDAIQEIVDDISPEANCQRVRIVETPMETTIAIVTDHPCRVDEPRIQNTIDQRLDLEFDSIEPIEPGTEIASLASLSPTESDEYQTLGDVTERSE